MQTVVYEKSIFKSKTFWANTISFVLILIPEVMKYLDGTLHVGDQNTVMLVLVQAQNIGNIALRILTQGPVKQRFTALRVGVNYLLGRGIK